MPPQIVRRLVGGIWRTVEADEAGGGGSQPGISVVDYLFTEVATAGVYTAPTLDLPENSLLIDVQWLIPSDPGGEWAADTALLDVVDSVMGTLVGGADVKNPGGSALVISAAQAVDLAQPYIYPNPSGGLAEPTGGGTITTTITTTIAVPPVVPVAVMIVRLVYITAPTPAPAVFA